MNKCFITKLPSSVDNDNLPVLGQLRINWLKQDGLTDGGKRNIGIKTNNKVTVKVSGAHFTDATLTSNLGNIETITSENGKTLYISNDSDAVLTIDNKYSLTELSFLSDVSDSTLKPTYLNLEDIKYCTNLTSLAIGTIQLSGDISALSNLTNVGALYLNDTSISGDISALSNFTKLGWVNINNTQLSGDISAMSNLTKLRHIDCLNTNITGDVSKLSNLTSLAANNNWKWTKGISLTGDMSKVPSNVFFISQFGRKINTNFTWTANGRQNATLLAMEGSIPFDTTSMDNMLIDQATCTVSPELNYNIISVKGTRTAASDAAVTAIQNKGITITGVTKQA